MVDRPASFRPEGPVHRMRASPREEPPRRPAGGRSLALTGLFVLAVAYTLHAARAVVLPMLLAILLRVILAPLVRSMTRLRIPEPLGAAVVMVALLGVVGLGFSQLAGPVADWIESAPQNLERVREKVHVLRGSMDSLSEATRAVERIASPNQAAPSEAAQEVVIRRQGLLDTLLGATPHVIFGLLVFLVLGYFLLASGDLFLRKLVRILPTFEDKKRAVEIARRLQSDVSQYLLTITLINAGLGVAVGIAMALVGMPTPFLWGTLAGVLNFVPYVGPVACGIVIALSSLLTFDALGQALIAPGVFVVLTTLEGYVVAPAILGHRLTLNTVVLFVWLILWGWIWGVPGMLIAVPVLAALKILCDRIRRFAPVGEFLGK
jgi:predicted PurR-regulated permease PerM